MTPAGAQTDVLSGDVGFSGFEGLPTIGMTAQDDGDVAPMAAPDNGWYRINPTTVQPQRRVAHIADQGVAGVAGDSGECTGFLVDPNFLVTAGHCVNEGGHNGTRGRWYSGFVVTPAKNGGSNPYGSCKTIKRYTTVAWADHSDSRFDYGGLKLDCNIGNQVGWFGYYYSTMTARASTR